MSTPQRLVPDIETIGQSFDALDEISKDYLKKYAEDEVVIVNL